MKNLELWNISVKNLKVNPEEELTICHSNEENSSDEWYVCSHNLIVSNFDEDGATKWCKDLSEISSPDNKPLDITHLSLPNSVCVGLTNGELITIGDSGAACNLAGVCDDGLLAMQWSPDQELLVLVTKQLNAILMSCMFDPINEVKLLDEEFGEKQFITVGWGKKETQFHGSEGKQAAKIKNEVSADLNSDTNDKVRITWRGDGNLYAIGFVIDGIRRFKVFDREGHLQYTSEKQQGLEDNLSWKPSGSVIATTQKLPDKNIIAFFEKNGLKHGGFDIPLTKDAVVSEISWSSDSEILALLCHEAESQKILLFTSGNWHWYLKQTLTFNSEQKIAKILWDNDFDVTNNKKLHVILHNGLHYTYTWVWSVNHSRGKEDNDDAIVTVIDGNKALVTGFRQTVVPPPMSALEIGLDSFINSIHFAPANVKDTNTFFVNTANGKLIFYEEESKFPLKYKESRTIDLDNYSFPFQYYYWYWLNSETIIAIKIDETNSFKIVEYNVASARLVPNCEEDLPEAVVRVECHPDDVNSVFLLLQSGEIIKYTVGGALEPQDISFSTPCLKFNVLSVEDEQYFIGLTHRGNLFINDSVALNNISSYHVHNHFLLLTSLKHVLLCTELSKIGLQSLVDYNKIESTHVYVRKIERGAKLVIAVPKHTRTVFQMPRGNLETVQPRPLSLKIIAEYLDDKKYHQAFDIMRKERINLNLFYDHDPEKFLNNVDAFVDSISNNTWLSLFISDLENNDVTRTMYSSSYAERIGNDIDGNKVKKICDVIKAYLATRTDSDTKILPLITAFVKLNTVYDLEQALNLIKNLKIQESKGSKLAVGSEEALKYLLYMVDVDRLFDVALGMYDFDLVLLVANKSQKDPKEYIAMLNEFNDLDETYRKFSINRHLKRFDKAVECLAKCGAEKHDELRTFVKFHSLYKVALTLFTPADEIYLQISEDYGLFLKLKKLYTEAGVVYERAKNLEKAVDCYKTALEWELAIKLAYLWPKEQFKELCWELVTELQEKKRHSEALTILEQHYDDKEATIVYAIENGIYKTALRLCSLYNNLDLKENRLLPKLLEDYRNLLETIGTNHETFKRYKTRLSIVREIKSKTPIEVFDPSYANKDSDLYSDAGSTVASSSSRSSSRTFRSSKNRRKHERKVISLKEGSRFEDVGLVNALHLLVTSSFELRQQVKDVNVALISFDKDKEASELQSSLEKLLKDMKDSFRDIWTPELMLEATNATLAARSEPEAQAAVIQGIASLEPHLIIAPVIQEIAWTLDGLC